jgi:hypothetical protein
MSFNYDDQSAISEEDEDMDLDFEEDDDNYNDDDDDTASRSRGGASSENNDLNLDTISTGYSSSSRRQGGPLGAGEDVDTDEEGEPVPSARTPGKKSAVTAPNKKGFATPKDAATKGKKTDAVSTGKYAYCLSAANLDDINVRLLLALIIRAYDSHQASLSFRICRLGQRTRCLSRIQSLRAKRP